MGGTEDIPESRVYYTYHQTPQMYGRYSREVGDYTNLEGFQLADKESSSKEKKQRAKELKGYQGKFSKAVSFVWRHTIARFGEDWVYLTIVSIVMGITAFIIDRGIVLANSSRNWLYKEVSFNHHASQYFAWISLPVTLVLFSATFVSFVGPQSVGSGIPEMKVILRGVTLKEYLTFRTLVAKMFGLTAALGSGLPLGKEGPFVHIACMWASVIGRLVTGFQGIYENKNRATEMLAAACALGVACTFASPIGGVLFSIEVTTSYYYVRNYWRAFYAAVWGTIVIRLLAVWCTGAHTLLPMWKTNFAMDFPYDPQELFVYALIGIACGVGGAAYILVHRNYVLFMRTNKTISKFMKKYRFFYPGFIALLVSSIMFPPGCGQFFGSTIPAKDQMLHLFSNFTWSAKNLTLPQHQVVAQWTTYRSGIFCHLSVFLAFNFFCSILSITLPAPCGSFVPVFKIGASFGRIIGELMHTWYPDGLYYWGKHTMVVPGGYAIVGAAAFTGAVTHTISTSLIAFELSGQISHVLPTLIATIISNAVAGLLAPSMYDSVILIKKLPYLPDLLPSTSGMYSIYVEDFMVKDVKFIYHKMTYEQLKNLLLEAKTLVRFPLVDNPKRRILLGSVSRLQLIKLIEQQIGRKRRMQVATMRVKAAQAKAREDALRDELDKLARFQVRPTSDVLVIPQLYGKPKKSILKYAIQPYASQGITSPFVSTSLGSPYASVTREEGKKMKAAFQSMIKRQQSQSDEEEIITSGKKKPRIIPFGTGKKVKLEEMYDMTPQEQKAWEEEQMRMPVDFSCCQIDPAPFQLVERTSLLKVHSLFSMVGVDLAYVTAVGRLVGVVGLKELRKAIEDANAGNLKPRDLEIRLDDAMNEKWKHEREVLFTDSEGESSSTLDPKV